MLKRGKIMPEFLVGLIKGIIVVVLLLIFLGIIRSFLDVDKGAISKNNFEHFAGKIQGLMYEKNDFKSDTTLLQLESEYIIVGFSKGQDSVSDRCSSDILFNDVEVISRPNECGSDSCICLYKNAKKTSFYEGNELVQCENVEADVIFTRYFDDLIPAEVGEQLKENRDRNANNYKVIYWHDVFKFANEFNYYNNEKSSLKNFLNLRGGNFPVADSSIYYYPLSEEIKYRAGYDDDDTLKNEQMSKQIDGRHFANFVLYGRCGILDDEGMDFNKEDMYIEKLTKNGKTYVFIFPRSTYTENRANYIVKNLKKLTATRKAMGVK
jgi:hypothetical protein